MVTSIKGNATSTFGGDVDLGANNLSTTGTIPAPAALSTATSSTSQPSYSVRAWIRWNGNGTGSGAIIGSAGVSSYTRVSTGNYDINWSTTLDDSVYAVTVCSSESRWDRGLSANAIGPTGISMAYEDTSGTKVDGGNLMLMMVR